MSWCLVTASHCLRADVSGTGVPRCRGSGFRAAHRARSKSRPVSPLRASIHAGKPALTPPASGLRAPLAPFRGVQANDEFRWPRPALNLPHRPADAIKGLSRHILGRRLPAVFHVPLTAPCGAVGRAYRVPPNPSGITCRHFVRSRYGKGSGRSGRAEKRLLTTPSPDHPASLKSGGVNTNG